MRLALVALVLAGSGAAGVHTGVIPIPARMAQAIIALGGDRSGVANIQIKSLRETYDDVQRGITSGHDAAKLGFQTSAVPSPELNTALKSFDRPLSGLPSNLGTNTAQQVHQSDDHIVDMRRYSHGPDARSGK